MADNILAEAQNFKFSDDVSKVRLLLRALADTMLISETPLGTRSLEFAGYVLETAE